MALGDFSDHMREQLEVAALVLSETKPTFTGHDFAEFVRMGGLAVGEEDAGEFLLEAVERGLLREIGPGVYSKARAIVERANLEEPLWPEEGA